MKEYYLDTHSSFCDTHINRDSWTSSMCVNNPERFLFFLKKDFYLITYHKCLNHYHIDFKMNLIKSIIGKHKECSKWEVERSMNVERDLKKWRIQNRELKKNIRQANYLYSDNAGREYAITTTMPYFDSLFESNEIEANYLKAKKVLEEKQYNWLIDDLTDLYRINDKLDFSTEMEIIKSTDKLIEIIKTNLN